MDNSRPPVLDRPTKRCMTCRHRMKRHKVDQIEYRVVVRGVCGVARCSCVRYVSFQQLCDLFTKGEG